MKICLSFVLLLASSFVAPAAAARGLAVVRVAVLDFGETETARRAWETVAARLSGELTAGGVKLVLLDRDMTRVAAAGQGYAGSLNLTTTEARSLGAALGADFFLVGDAQTLRRSSFNTPVYYESYASVFVVSSRTGRLIAWDRPSAEAAAHEQAERAMLERLGERTRANYRAAIFEAREGESREAREGDAAPADGMIDLTSDDGAGGMEKLRPPAPYRRIRPEYPDAAARAEAEATVDVFVDIDARGMVARVNVVRWAGFGLDESVISAVRNTRFRPAMLSSAPVPVRVLLRYNFRRPPREGVQPK